MDIQIKKNIVYGENDLGYLIADIYKPLHYEGDLSIIMLIHGGAYQTGSKEMYVDWGKALAKEGYFVIAINYRLAHTTRKIYPEVFSDMDKAFNYLIKIANEEHLNLDQIGLFGDSAGAYLASYYTLTNRPYNYRINAVVGAYGIYDLIEEYNHPTSVRTKQMLSLFLGKDFKEDQELYTLASPMNYIDYAIESSNFDTEFLITWGAKDKIVKETQSINFIKALEERGVQVEQYRYEDVGHFWFNELTYVEGGRISDYPNVDLYPHIIKFLQRTLKEKPNGNFSKQTIKNLHSIDSLNIIN